MTPANALHAPRAALDPGMQIVLGDIAAREGNGGDAIEEARRSELSFLDWSRPAAPVASVEDTQIEGPRRPLRVRVYRPTNGLAPPLLYLHGGAWSAGSLELCDRFCRRLCAGSGRLVASLEYALAPEEPYPAALDDCAAASAWLSSDGAAIGSNGAQMIVVGESAGANLAASLCLRVRGEGVDRIGRQILITPVLDDYVETESHRRWGGGEYLISSAGLAASWRTYLGSRPIDMLAAPLRATDLRGLPRATIIVAGCDPLHDDGLLYARRLTGPGARVDLARHDGVVHARRQADGGTQVEVVAAPALLHAFIYMDGVSAAAAQMVDRISELAA